MPDRDIESASAKSTGRNGLAACGHQSAGADQAAETIVNALF